MKNYSFEKGKHGSATGAIFPFFTDLNGLLPLDQDYRDYCPAGFLKCRGQILQADQFPALAEILGVGSQCIYRKEGVTLQERDDNGTGGTFQLPDLGSKYITASSNPGSYNNDTTTDENNNPIQRAGIGTVLTSSGDIVEFGYTGDFSAPAFPLSFTGQWRFLSPPSRTPAATTTIGNFIAHGHLGDYSIGARINQNNQALRQCVWNGPVFFIIPCGNPTGRAFAQGDLNPGVQHVYLSFDDAGEDSDHAHPLGTPTLATQGPTGTIPAVTLSASGITTTVNIRTRQISKMDDIAPKFIIAEYLIKF
jgi:hypothetical protein